MTTKRGFVSDPDRGVYFWSHSAGERHYVFSNAPHEGLPHYCDKHRWYSDVPCRACETAVPVSISVHRASLPSAQMELPWS